MNHTTNWSINTNPDSMNLSDVLLRDTLDLSQVFSCNSSFIREKDGENDTGSSDNGAVPSVGVDPNLTKEAQTESGT